MFGVGKCRPTLNPTPENLVRLPEGHKYGDRHINTSIIKIIEDEKNILKYEYKINNIIS